MRRLSTLTLHRYRLGELAPAEVEAIRAHLEACPEDRARLDAQEAQRRAFALEPMPRALRDLRVARSAPWWRLPALVFAAAAAMFLAFPRGLEQAGSETTRAKGLPALSVLVAGQGLWSPGRVLHPGDRVQIQAPAGPWTEAWVTDGKAVLGHFELQRSEPTLAPFSLTLDDAPGDETVVVLLATASLSPEDVVALLKKPDPARIQALSLTLPKAP